MLDCCALLSLIICFPICYFIVLPFLSYSPSFLFVSRFPDKFLSFPSPFSWSGFILSYFLLSFIISLHNSIFIFLCVFPHFFPYVISFQLSLWSWDSFHSHFLISFFASSFHSHFPHFFLHHFISTPHFLTSSFHSQFPPSWFLSVFPYLLSSPPSPVPSVLPKD